MSQLAVRLALQQIAEIFARALGDVAGVLGEVDKPKTTVAAQPAAAVPEEPTAFEPEPAPPRSEPVVSEATTATTGFVADENGLYQLGVVAAQLDISATQLAPILAARRVRAVPGSHGARLFRLSEARRAVEALYKPARHYLPPAGFVKARDYAKKHGLSEVSVVDAILKKEIPGKQAGRIFVVPADFFGAPEHAPAPPVTAQAPAPVTPAPESLPGVGTVRSGMRITAAQQKNAAKFAHRARSIPIGPNTPLPIDTIAPQLGRSRNLLADLIARGVLKPEPGTRLFTIAAAEAAFIAAGVPKRTDFHMSPGFVKPVEVARVLRMSEQSMKGALQSDKIPHRKVGKFYEIPIEYLELARSLVGELPIVDTPARVSTPAPAPKPRTLTPGEAFAELAEEVKTLADALTPASAANQLAVWAGLARKLLEEVKEMRESGETTSLTMVIHSLLQELRVLAKRHDVFVAALLPSWEFEDWSLYVAAHAHERAKESLGSVEREALAEADLRALRMANGSVPPGAIAEIIGEATKVLPSDNALLVLARRGMQPKGETAIVPLRSPVAAEPLPDYITPEILALTEGKRAIVIGAIRMVAHQEKYVEELRFASVYWAEFEKNKMPKVEVKGYDLVIYPVKMNSHLTMHYVREAKAARIPVVMLNGGCSVDALARAIQTQVLPPKRVAKTTVSKWAARA